ncbi:outer membrane protein assembly factor BamE [Salmonella enterica]|nr:outer membrane protein assembly factor BamE [Salmonella enterica]EHW9864313.1 outer membrane protein assembly factor BamE [Salmonella enterica subsp. enterica serovar Poona]EBI1927637.1 outer membrane protein assembly factor BamE [Salmonella enterica]EHM1731231.1 outer membrane protein assembly factor BamE [Salmonella enterica]EHO1656870.1 outer membrane protein assembly factor BamE [Salmonella enterica]
MKIYPAQSLLLIAVAGLFGCHQNPSHPERDGSIKEIVWPAPERAKQGTGKGVFLTAQSIALLNKGMTKEQLYLLIGRPHFDEGIFSVREWDYLIYFRTPSDGMDGITTCQLKIVYNSDKLVTGIYWKTVKPEDSLCPPSFYSQKENNRYELRSDILFGLNQYELDKLNPDELKNIDKIISDIRGIGDYGSVSVYGYTDRQGDRNYNMKLSLLRAKSVGNYFMDNNFPKEKIFAKGMGETIPETSCPDLTGKKLTDCLQSDRKVVIVVNPIKSNSK